MVRARAWPGWQPLQLVGQRLDGKKLGIYGFGKIGQALAKRARGFDMEIHYYDIYRQTAREGEGARRDLPFEPRQPAQDLAVLLHQRAVDAGDALLLQQGRDREAAARRHRREHGARRPRQGRGHDRGARSRGASATRVSTYSPASPPSTRATTTCRTRSCSRISARRRSRRGTRWASRRSTTSTRSSPARTCRSSWPEGRCPLLVILFSARAGHGMITHDGTHETGVRRGEQPTY